MNIRLPHRKNRFLNLVTDKLNSLFDKRPRCSYRRNFWYQKSNLIEINRLCPGQSTALKPYKNTKFMKSFDIYLLDKSLYANYATYLLNQPQSSAAGILGEKPIVLFVDYKVMFFVC
jgi:hypothetical protein